MVFNTESIAEEELQVLPEHLNVTAHSETVVGLVYMFDNQPGFTRYKSGDKFYYMDGTKEIQDKEQLERFKCLVLPPAWQNVWICKLDNGHLQATGYDQLNRKQYRYHPLWITIRNQTKFYRLKEFGKRLPLIRANLERDLSLSGFPKRKVMAVMVSLLEMINIRVGNAFYEKFYGSLGINTLKDRHAKIEESKLNLLIVGKKGISHKVTLSSKRLANIVKGCKEIPGKELFQYYDEEGYINPVDSGDLNNYIKEISGADFTAKDFRTWAGSVHAILGFKSVGGFETITEMNRKIPEVIDRVAKHLGNTRTVCKKYYIHPIILILYKEQKLEEYIADLKGETKTKADGYMDEEKVLLRILETENIRNKHMKG